MASFFHVDFRGELLAEEVLTNLPVTSLNYPEDADYINHNFPEGLSYFGAMTMLHTEPDRPEVAIEQILETVRRMFVEKCKVNYPSRLSSLFATDSLETARIFRSNYQRADATIWLVEAEEFFKADMSLVTPDLIGDHNLAVHYWQGKPKGRVYASKPLEIVGKTKFRPSPSALRIRDYLRWRSPV